MSASLVGSEMCIRDSADPHKRTQVPTLKVPLCTWGARGAWNMQGRFRCCLLYTSDAADDM
eukprot:194585-Alexandrium_andersonii.AAC.1